VSFIFSSIFTRNIINKKRPLAPNIKEEKNYYFASDKNVFDIGIGIRLGAKEEVGVGHGNNGWHR
jgi:hypothetical protein